MNIIEKMHYRYFVLVAMYASVMQAAAPLGLFAPYDINLNMKKPAPGSFQINILGEKSYKTQGYATNQSEDQTILVNPLQIYDQFQNIVSMYQGADSSGNIVQTISTPFTALLDSIAGGPAGGVSNYQNGIYIPCGTLSCSQIAGSVTAPIGKAFFLSAFLPVYFAQLTDVSWTYQGNNQLFSGALIQKELIDLFAQDAATYFDLNIGGWKRTGIGDLTLLAQWQRDFVQRRPVLKNVAINARAGISIPTASQVDENIIMPCSFGADGAISFPIGASMGLFLGPLFECGFSGQFWFYLSKEKCRRVKTFPTQTSLLYPAVVQTYKKNAVLQNFNLYAQLYAPGKRVSAKMVYQHWRKQQDELCAVGSQYNTDFVNGSAFLAEWTKHQFEIFGIYSPIMGDFEKIIPQFEIFWKSSFGGMRTVTASTFGAQFSLIF